MQLELLSKTFRVAVVLLLSLWVLATVAVIQVPTIASALLAIFGVLLLRFVWQSLSSQHHAWDDLGELDPFWAILTEPGKKGRWGLDEFFASGREQIRSTLLTAQDMGMISGEESALDFGCGVGRLTAALREYYRYSLGVDVSASMIAKAREFCPHCDFMLSTGKRLNLASESFDLVLSLICLQHLSGKREILNLLSEFIRVLKPRGTLIFQLPSRMPLRNRFQPRRRLYSLLRWLGVPARLLFRCGLDPMQMTAVPKRAIHTFLEEHGMIVRVCSDTLADESLESLTYYCMKPSASHTS